MMTVERSVATNGGPKSSPAKAVSILPVVSAVQSLLRINSKFVYSSLNDPDGAIGMLLSRSVILTVKVYVLGVPWVLTPNKLVKLLSVG